MVKCFRKWTGLLTGLVLFSGGTAKADGILEKMQTEVADLTEKMRGAVVTIQDEQGVLQGGDVFFYNDPLHDMRGLLYKLDAERNNLNSQRSAIESQIKAYKTRAKTEANTKELEGLLKRQLLLLQCLDNLKTDKEQSSTRLKTLRKDLFVEQLGGKESSDSLKREGYPILSDIPIVGTVFQKATQSPHKSEMQVKIFVSKTGSGFSIGDGYIVTTGDVALSLRQPIVVTDNGTRLKARVVGSNADLNIGLLKITTTTMLPSLRMGDSRSVKAGHFAVSMGNQAGQNNSVALMLVGNIRNEGTYAGRQFYPSLIQIAGTVGAGASGAPLVNVKGEVIGMMAAIPMDNNTWNNQAIRINDSNMLNVMPHEAPVKIPNSVIEANSFLALMHSEPAVTSAGFAIPINQIKPIIEELRLGTPIAHGWLGIAPEDVSRIVDKGNGVIDAEVMVRVVGVYPESPAMVAGIRPGDILVSIDGKPVRNASIIRQTSLRIRKGDRVTFTVRRGKETKDLALKIESRPQVIKAPITTPPKE